MTNAKARTQIVVRDSEAATAITHFQDHGTQSEAATAVTEFQELGLHLPSRHKVTVPHLIVDCGTQIVVCDSEAATAVTFAAPY